MTENPLRASFSGGTVHAGSSSLLIKSLKQNRAPANVMHSSPAPLPSSPPAFGNQKGSKTGETGPDWKKHTCCDALELEHHISGMYHRRESVAICHTSPEITPPANNRERGLNSLD